jgi:hypothetical protein
MRFLRAELPKRKANGNIDKTHCKFGHELAGYNLMVSPNARSKTGFQRRCRTCHNATTYRNYHKKKLRDAAR